MTTRADLFAAVRPFAPDGKFKPEHVPLIDAIADAFGMPRDGVGTHRLGKLSEQFESGGRGPGTVSSGAGDPGGVSYGLYQLASKVGTLGDFLEREGAPWKAELSRGGLGGSPGFTAVWKHIAQREPEPFTGAQHAFIERSHYRPAVARVLTATGLDLNARSPAVRDVTWSTSVQHGRAAMILADAIAAADKQHLRTDPEYDAAFIRALYKRRSDYVRGVAQGHTGTTRNSLLSIVENRYPAEQRAALAMLGT